MSNIKSNYADLGDGIVHYLTAGKGEPLVLLHGIPQTSYEWRYVIPMLEDKFQIIAPDLRGLGDNTRAANGFDKKTVASDVWRLLHDHLKIDEFNLVGHDWGGPTAFALTCAHQEAVRKLAILDVAIPGDGADFSQNGRRWHHAFFSTAHLPEALLHGREDIYINWLFENYSYLPNSISEEDRKEYLRTYSKPGAMTALFEYYRALPQDAKDNQEFIATHGKLKMPVLALGGDKSFGRGIETLESMQRMAVNVTGGLVPNSGHWVTEEQPEFVAKALRDFFLGIKA